MRSLRQVYHLSGVLQVGVDIFLEPPSPPLISRRPNSGVHDIHPIHPFLEIKEKPVSRTSDDTAPEDNADEPCQRPHSSAPLSTHVLRFGSSQAP